MDGRERWERTRGGLVVPGGLGTGAAAWVVAGEEERATTLVVKVGGLELRLEGEDELEGAVGVGAVGGHVEAEDGGDVVGGEDAVVLRAERLVGLILGDLGDVVRELELTGRQVSRTAAVALCQGSLAEDLSGVCGDEASQHGESSNRLHLEGGVLILRSKLEVMGR